MTTTMTILCERCDLVVDKLLQSAAAEAVRLVVLVVPS